jgi:hypothetical protein
MDKKKAFRDHVKRPNVPRAPMPLDSHLKGGERRLRISTILCIRSRCAGGGCPNSAMSRNRGHEPYCAQRRDVYVGLSFQNPITGPRAKGIKASGATPTTVVVVADVDEEDPEPRATERYPLATEAPVARASVALEMVRAEAPSGLGRFTAPHLLQVIIYSLL